MAYQPSRSGGRIDVSTSARASAPHRARHRAASKSQCDAPPGRGGQWGGPGAAGLPASQPPSQPSASQYVSTGAVLTAVYDAATSRVGTYDVLCTSHLPGTAVCMCAFTRIPGRLHCACTAALRLVGCWLQACCAGWLPAWLLFPLLPCHHRSARRCTHSGICSMMLARQYHGYCGRQRPERTFDHQPVVIAGQHCHAPELSRVQSMLPLRRQKFSCLRVVLSPAHLQLPRALLHSRRRRCATGSTNLEDYPTQNWTSPGGVELDPALIDTANCSNTGIIGAGIDGQQPKWVQVDPHGPPFLNHIRNHQTVVRRVPTEAGPLH